MECRENSHSYVMRIEGEYNFTRDKGEILKALLDSKLHQTMIGLAIPTIGTGVFITSIEEIFLDDVEPIVQLKYLDVNGRLIEKTRFYLREIIGACPLHSKWINPLLRNHLASDYSSSETDVA